VSHHHHERFDGKGYPDGLVGEDIPVGSRIIPSAIPTTPWPATALYRAAMCSRGGQKILPGQRGSSSTRKLVDLFLSSLPKMKEVHVSRTQPPAAEIAAAQRTPADRTRAAPGGPPAGEILILNRDPEVRAFVNRALFAGNFSSTSVNGSEEAKAILRRGGVALLLLGIEDSITPEQEALISQLVAERPELPVVAIGSRPPADLVRQVLLRGVRDFILDALDAPALTRRLKELMPVPRDPAGEERPYEPAEAAAPAPATPAGAAGPPAEPVIIAKNPRMLRVLRSPTRSRPPTPRC
jgi:CheY-like chemotaxis protein